MQRTHAAVLGAFIGLVTQRRYEDLTIEDIVRRSGVGRSTLYEHFPGKDSILKVSLRGPFSILADAIRPADNTASLTRLLEHFWSNRALGSSIFAGPTREKCLGVLIGHVEQRLVSRPGGAALIVPTRLAATQIAEALLAPVLAWLFGKSRCPAAVLAAALRKSSIALVVALSRD